MNAKPRRYYWQIQLRTGRWRRLPWPMSEADAHAWAVMQSECEQREVAIERLESAAAEGEPLRSPPVL